MGEGGGEGERERERERESERCVGGNQREREGGETTVLNNMHTFS